MMNYTSIFNSATCRANNYAEHGGGGNMEQQQTSTREGNNAFQTSRVIKEPAAV
ncbi:hypothetical protein HanRHA438_Chr05g0205391 [Helianthus annuus]|nr:hypothetical protein HanRHA438_Chr05g0205391 [Helianthus annuus]